MSWSLTITIFLIGGFVLLVHRTKESEGKQAQKGINRKVLQGIKFYF